MSYLRVSGLGSHVTHGVGVPRESVDTRLGAHVPHLMNMIHNSNKSTPHCWTCYNLHTDPCSGVSAACYKHIKGGMEGHTVHATQMTMVVADHLRTNGM